MLHGTMPATMYLTGATNEWTEAAAAVQPRFGMLAQPGNALHRQSKLYDSWAVDNGAFGKAQQGHTWNDNDTAEYLAYLAKVRAETDCSNALFATAPDVLTFVDGAPIGNAAKTWAQSREIFPLIRQLGFKAALVAQDGILQTSPMCFEWDEFDVLFLGGSDIFKLGYAGKLIAGMARARGKWVHMGRVNSEKRFRIAQRIGCHSADGTYVRFGPKPNVPKVMGWLRETAPLAGQPIAA